MRKWIRLKQLLRLSIGVVPVSDRSKLWKFWVAISVILVLEMGELYYFVSKIVRLGSIDFEAVLSICLLNLFLVMVLLANSRKRIDRGKGA
jgi:cytosine/uracil/thiamine/allantoin permease